MKKWGIKEWAEFKQKEKPTKWELLEGTVAEQDNTVSLFCEWYFMGCKSIDALIDRILHEGLAKLTIHDFHEPLENYDRFAFLEMVNGIADTFGYASREYQLSIYPEIRFRYERRSGLLATVIRQQSPDPRAQQLAAAIDRLTSEVYNAFQRGIDQYEKGGGKPQAADLLSDARHGALWDNVENAVAALSAVQAEKIATEKIVKAEMLRAHKRGKEKMDAAAMRAAIRQEQREAAARLIKSERDKGKECSPKDAANSVFYADKRKGGYVSTGSLTKDLYINAAELGIDQFIDHSGKRGRPRKGEAKPRK